MKMGMPDILFINTDGFKGGDPENLEVWFEYMGALEGSIPASVHEYHHSRIVEALRREHEELKAKLDKAKDALLFYGDEVSQVAEAIIDVMPDSRGEPMEYIKDFDSPYNLDKGQRARKTLEEM